MPNPHDSFRAALILIADDDSGQRILLRAALEQGGFTVVEASNGVEALERYRLESPDLVLLDVNMPGMDGYTACESIRTGTDGKDTPIVMVTGLDDIESIDRAYGIGATDFMTKPVVLHTLCYRVRYLLKASKAFRQLNRSKESLAFAQHVAEMGNWMLEISSQQFYASEEVHKLIALDPSKHLRSLNQLIDYVHPDDQALINNSVTRLLQDGKEFKLEHRLIRKGGEILVVEQQAKPVINNKGEITQLHGIVHNITARKKAEQKIRQLAYFDPLTGLPNRQMFRSNIERLIYSARKERSKFALLFIDLDNFKDVNDTLGNSAGDCLLQQIAEYIHEGIRSSDVMGIIEKESKETETKISRLGGDEFTILIPQIKNIDDVSRIAQRVLDNLQQPMNINGNMMSVTGSIGIATFPYDGEEPDALLKNADIAMYHAKQSGKNKFRFFDWQMNERIMVRVRMEADLREAIDNKEFSLHYQPKVELLSGRVTGLEALLRWNKPGTGPVSPMEFIPIAEESGLIIPIGEWVIKEACQQARRWQLAGIKPLVISVNLSPKQFHTHNLLSVVKSSLEKNALKPEYFELELTESAVMEDIYP